MPEFKALRSLPHDGRRIQKGQIFSVSDAQAANLLDDPNPAAVPVRAMPAGRPARPEGKNYLVLEDFQEGHERYFKDSQAILPDETAEKHRKSLKPIRAGGKSD